MDLQIAIGIHAACEQIFGSSYSLTPNKRPFTVIGLFLHRASGLLLHWIEQHSLDRGTVSLSSRPRTTSR